MGGNTVLLSYVIVKVEGALWMGALWIASNFETKLVLMKYSRSKNGFSKSYTTTQWIIACFADNHIEVWDWPRLYPDLNMIENIFRWSY